MREPGEDDGGTSRDSRLTTSRLARDEPWRNNAWSVCCLRPNETPDFPVAQIRQKELKIRGPPGALWPLAPSPVPPVAPSPLPQKSQSPPEENPNCSRKPRNRTWGYPSNAACTTPAARSLSYTPRFGLVGVPGNLSLSLTERARAIWKTCISKAIHSRNNRSAHRFLGFSQLSPCWVWRRTDCISGMNFSWLFSS